MDDKYFLYAYELINTNLVNLDVNRAFNSIGSNIFFEFGKGKEIVYKKSSIVKIQNPVTKKYTYACIYNYLSGETIAWESYTMKHIKLLGKTMSDMHYELQKLQIENIKLPSIRKELEEDIIEMKKYFQKNGVTIALRKKLKLVVKLNLLDKYNKLISEFIDKKDIVIHMDFVRGNILFTNKADLEISGILDFEKVAIGPRIFDIARTLAFLLIDCKYKKDYKIKKYFLYSGYNKRGRLGLPNLTTLEYLIDYFLIFDFYKFLLHNPYESLYLNEHFIRIQDYLLKRKIIFSCLV